MQKYLVFNEFEVATMDNESIYQTVFVSNWNHMMTSTFIFSAQTLQLPLLNAHWHFRIIPPNTAATYVSFLLLP